MKKSPFCAEEIQDEAIKCRYCGERLHPFQTYRNNGEEEQVQFKHTALRPPWWKSPFLWAILFGFSMSFLALIGQMAFIPEVFFGYSDNIILSDLLMRLVFYFIVFWLLFLLFTWVWRKSKLVFGIIVTACIFALFYVPPTIITNQQLETSSALSTPGHTPTPTLSEYLYFDIRHHFLGCALEDQPIFSKPYGDLVGNMSMGECWLLQRKTRNEEWIETEDGWVDSDKVLLLTRNEVNATIMARVTATAAAKP